MRVIIFILRTVIPPVLCLFLMNTGLCQTQTFDIARYIAPKNWKKDTRPGIVLLTSVDEAKGMYCMIALYASAESSSNAQQDFTNEWNSLAVDTYGAAADPKVETETTPDGWTVKAGASPVAIDSVNSFLVLTVYSGFGKKFSVLANFNNESYIKTIELLLDNLRLDKKKEVAKKKPSTAKPNEIATNPIPVLNIGDEELESLGHLRLLRLKTWKVQKYTDALILSPKDLSPDQYLEVRFMGSKPFSGNLQQAMSESWNDALEQLKCIPAYNGQHYDIITQRTSYKGWEYIKARGTVKKSPGSPDKYDMHLFIVKLNNRIERMIVVGLLNIQGGSFCPYVNPIYRDDVDNLFFNLKFDDWKDPSITKAMIFREGLTGMYAGLSLKSGVYMGQYALFYSNGQVFFGGHFPSSGFNELNTWIAAELDTRSWGRYTFQNGAGIIKMGYGNIPFKVNGNDLLITTQNKEHKYERFPSVDGAVLDGNYGFTGDWGGKNPTVTFTRDGKFVDYGCLDVLNHQTGDPFNLTDKPGQGTYQIRDYSIIFNYIDGRKLSILFIGGNGFNKSNPSPASLVLSSNYDQIQKLK